MTETPSTRAEAKLLGKPFYFTGEPCKRGHVADRYTCNSTCVGCRPVTTAEWRDRQMEELSTEGFLAKERTRSQAQFHANPEPHRQDTRVRVAAGVVGLRAHRLRTPPNQTADERAAIRAFYAARPAGCHVDHVVPIEHRTRPIGGLHVLANLQYLTRKQHRRKDREFNPTHGEAEDFVARGLAVWSEDVDETGNVAWDRYPSFCLPVR